MSREKITSKRLKFVEDPHGQGDRLWTYRRPAAVTEEASTNDKQSEHG